MVAVSEESLEPGTIVAGKYRLERVLGRGGMGMVIAARHVQLGTSFALKFLHRSILGTETVPERFLREARATAALRSEHVCRVFDVGSFEDTPYLVMELLQGTDLERVLRRERRLSPQVACNYLIQACAGVSEAHAAKIVHRDLKPGNLFLVSRTDGGSIVKVLDFGIAKAPAEAELGLTGTDAILGSPAYMSLEQLRSSRLVDTRSDIWSLGVILYELISGRRPFHGEGVADLALRIAMEPIPKLPEDLASSGLSAGKLARMHAALDGVIGRCLARDPAQRYQSVAELALALAPFADEPEKRIASSLGRSARWSAPSIEIVDPDAPPGDSQAATTLQSSGVIEGVVKGSGAGRRPRGRASRLALAAAVAGIGALGGLALRSGVGMAEDAPPSPAASTVAAPAAPTVAAPAAPKAAPPPEPASGPGEPALDAAAASPTIGLRFAIEPAGAAIELDGVFVTARQITVRRDDEPHHLRISAPGYVAQDREVRFDDTQKLVIQLRRLALRPATAARSTPAPTRPAIDSHSPYE